MSHHQEDIFENRKQFQLERMILFSDAVFAIVITLLVIEIKVPETAHAGLMTRDELAHHLWLLLPHFFGFIMSFVIVGMFWQVHHRIFGHVTNFDGGLIWLNLLLLLTICGIPFTTSLTSTHGYLNLAYSIYSINLGLIGLMSFFVFMRISNPRRNLSVGLEDARLRRFGRARSFAICLIFFSGAILCLFDSEFLSWTARFVFILIFPAIVLLKKLYKVEDR